MVTLQAAKDRLAQRLVLILLAALTCFAQVKGRAVNRGWNLSLWSNPKRLKQVNLQNALEGTSQLLNASFYLIFSSRFRLRLAFSMHAYTFSCDGLTNGIDCINLFYIIETSKAQRRSLKQIAVTGKQIPDIETVNDRGSSPGTILWYHSHCKKCFAFV